MGEDAGAPRYRFGPLERRGLVAGWRGGQIAVVALGLVMAVGILRMSASAGGVAGAFVAVAAAVAAATWPVAGRTVEEWAPDAARHADVLRGRRKVGCRHPFATLRYLQVDLTAAGTESTRFGTTRIGATRSSGRGRGDGNGNGERRRGQGSGAGVVNDVARHTYTAVLSVSGPGFVLLGGSDKARRVGAWAGVLASLARDGSAVHRVQWIERSLPDEGVEVRRHLADAAVLDTESPPHRSYADLLEGEIAAVHRHEVLLAVTIHASRTARAVRAAGGGQRGACTVLLRESASLARRLGEAGFQVAGILDLDALVAAVRSGFDAESLSRPRLDGAAPPSAGDGPVRRSTSWPGPMGLLAEWGSVRTDATWHCTYWIAEWPRTDVAPDFLGPLLLVSDVRRSVSVVMEPVGALRAARHVEQARTADVADAELRRRGGFLATARRRREEEVLLEREGELADGHASFRFSGYVTVSSTDRDELEEACGRIERTSGQAGLELRRCYGDQAMALTCTLPLGRGLS
ncbi:MAG TPA: SCO6880 family protein [Acidimicrobiales bacterium]|nr:SCO6880 family protein [Acidimicrobiales bacterium]